MPKVVDEYIKNGSIREEIYTTYLNVILGDLNSLHKNETMFRQLAANIIKVLCDIVDYFNRLGQLWFLLLYVPILSQYLSL
jgi:hypothetical protein